MSIPRRGSRGITVDGIRLRWRIRPRPTPDQRSGRTPLILAVAAEAGEGPAMIARVQSHPRNAAGLRSNTVTPGHVALYVREALAAGWRPLEPGRQFVLEPRTLHTDGDLRIVPPRHRPLGPEALSALARGPKDALRLAPARAVSWPGGGGYQPGGLEINGRDLISLVYDVERPFVDAELAARREAGEDLDPRMDYAGEYLGLSEREYRLPSRVLLGEVPSSEVRAFAVSEEDPRRAMTTLLSCTCGISECWFLLARITVLDEAVIWSGFEQFHRTWLYDLGPFVFDKRAYLDAIAG